MFVDRRLTLEFDGDVSKLSEQQVETLINSLLGRAVGNDPARIAATRKQLEAQAAGGAARRQQLEAEQNAHAA